MNPEEWLLLGSSADVMSMALGTLIRRETDVHVACYVSADPTTHMTHVIVHTPWGEHAIRYVHAQNSIHMGDLNDVVVQIKLMK